MPRLECISILEAGSIGSDSGSVDVPTGEDPFPVEELIYSLIFVLARNSENIPVVML
jgi:hypothetical protein